MSLFTGSHPGFPQPQNIFKSEIKNKLGFSIDSIVGKSETRSESPVSPPPHAGTWSPQSASPPRVKQRISASPPLITRDRSRSPIRQRSSSPGPLRQSPPVSPSPSPASPPSLSSVYRPTPTSLPHSPSVAQSYLDQVAALKAIYEAKGQSVQLPGNPLMNPGLSLPSGLPGFHRPPSSLPPFLGLPGQFPGSPLAPQPPHVPREFPLHPWFINRHRFPLGKLTKLTKNILVTCLKCYKVPTSREQSKFVLGDTFDNLSDPAPPHYNHFLIVNLSPLV